MTPADQRASGCDGKQRFDTHKLAMSVLQRRRPHKGDAPASAYRCTFCSGWHLGSAKSSRVARKVNGMREAR